MADVGIRGEQAGTTLRGGLVQLLKPAEKTAKMMESMGIQVTDANGKFIGLAGVIREFQESMEGMTDAQKLATLSQIVGTEAASGFLALMKAGPSEIEKMTKALENSGGASKEAAEQMMGGLGGAIEQMSGAFETMQIIIGDHLTPIIQRVVEWITKLIEAFNNAPPKLQKFISIAALVLATLTGFIAVVGTVAAGIGLFMMSIAPLLPFLTKLGGKLKVVGGLFAFLTSPISLAVIALGALIAVFVALYKHSEPFRASIDKIGGTLKGAFVSGVVKAGEVLTKLKNVFVELVNTRVVPFFESLADVISRAFSGDFSGVANMFGQLVPTIIGFLVGGIPALILTGARFLPAIAEGMQQNLPALLNGITAVITNVITAITTYLPMFVQSGVDVLTKLIEGLTTAIPLILPAVITIVTTLITTLAQFFPQFVQAGVTVLTNLLNGIVNALPLIVTAILTLVTTILSVIAENLPRIITAGITILTALIEGIITLMPAIIDAVLSIILTIAQTVIDNLPKIIDAGIKILDALINGIISILPQLINAGIMLILALFGALIANLPKIIDAGIKVLTALIEGIMKILPQLLDAGLTLVVKLAGALIDNLPKIIVAGGKILLALLDGIAKLIPELLSLGWDLVKKLAGAIGDKVDDIFNVGADLIKGLWKGINSVKDWIIGKIGGFTDSVLKSIKSFFGIHSPSRVMRDEVGKYLPLGLIAGIQRMKNDVISAAEQMTEWATPDVPRMSLAYSTPTGVYGSLSSAVNGTVDVNSREELLAQAIANLERKLDGLTVEMDGKQVGKIVAPTVSSEINRQTRSERKGGGRRVRI
jgi:phage-related protein